MPEGKAAGERCIHLLENLRCNIYNTGTKPKVCEDFKAEEEFCGSNQEEALEILFSLSERPPSPLKGE
jgi:hypothetical protein